MSRVSAHGLRLLVLAICLWGSPGCQVPGVPEHAKNQTRPEDTRDDNAGLLYRTGESQKKTDDKTSDSAVRPASFEQANGGNPVVSSPIAVAPAPLKEDDDEGGFDLSFLAPANVYKKIKAAAGRGPNEKVAHDAFLAGKELYYRGQYAEAVEQFAITLDRVPEKSVVLEEDAMFMLAESLFFSDQYNKAEDAYEALLKKYEFSRYLDRAVAKQFAIGRYWEQFEKAESHWAITPNFLDKRRPMFDTWGYALKSYEHVRLNDPTSPMAEHALMATANAYFVAGRYEDASFHYDQLRKEYPKSTHQLRAHLLSLECKRRMYQGASYDVAPLREAREVADQTLIRFGNQLGPERERIIQVKNELNEQLAQRDWEIAQYYDKKKYYGSARYYYQAAVKDYPNTKTAQMAWARIQQIQGMPAEPTDYFKTLAKYLEKKDPELDGPAGAAPDRLPDPIYEASSKSTSTTRRQ